MSFVIVDLLLALVSRPFRGDTSTLGSRPRRTSSHLMKCRCDVGVTRRSSGGELAGLQLPADAVGVSDGRQLRADAELLQHGADL